MGSSRRDSFYAAADLYFRQHEPGAQINRDKRTLADVIAHVNAGAAPALRIIIVSHANEEGNLGFSVDAADLRRDTRRGDRKPRIEFKELRDAVAGGALPIADVAKIDGSTRVEIRGCNIGRSTRMLDALDQAFGGATQVTAPTHKQEYSARSGGRGRPRVTDEALFQYSIEDPGHPTVSSADRGARFRAKYPDVPARLWPALLAAARERHVKRKAYEWTGVNPPADDAASVFARLGTNRMFPARRGWVVTYKGRTTVGDNWRFEVQADRVTSTASETRTSFVQTAIPPDGAVLREREMADSGRPDAADWTVVDRIVGRRLVRTVYAEHTEWVINRRIVGASGTAHPPMTDPTFFGQSTFTPTVAPNPPSP
ncbi:hypothetical protein [Agromyces kandeliae]|uniref:Uncharacterized protein n=1 Tax=Agromyces kandeliae TaxID=2666141 RepID=A0A6L5R202_9MICO|nr:hypothetical protein [Agromyces kandeliae]MRX43498.1 hypothetical protein [Agromyces kandeliae]